MTNHWEASAAFGADVMAFVTRATCAEFDRLEHDLAVAAALQDGDRFDRLMIASTQGGLDVPLADSVGWAASRVDP